MFKSYREIYLILCTLISREAASLGGRPRAVGFELAHLFVTANHFAKIVSLFFFCPVLCKMYLQARTILLTARTTNKIPVAVSAKQAPRAAQLDSSDTAAAAEAFAQMTSRNPPTSFQRKMSYFGDLYDCCNSTPARRESRRHTVIDHIRGERDTQGSLDSLRPIFFGKES